MFTVIVIVYRVAPLAGSVDRNLGRFELIFQKFVAPLAGSVDRNNWLNLGKQLVTAVAPPAGRVDRNGDIVDDAYWGSGRSPRGERG